MIIASTLHQIRENRKKKTQQKKEVAHKEERTEYSRQKGE
jgi:hypothetical protein